MKEFKMIDKIDILLLFCFIRCSGGCWCGVFYRGCFVVVC